MQVARPNAHAAHVQGIFEKNVQKRRRLEFVPGKKQSSFTVAIDSNGKPQSHGIAEQARAQGSSEMAYGLFDPAVVTKYLRWQQIRRIGPGFFNDGNSCYLNTTLQCLLYLPPLVQIILHEQTPLMRAPVFKLHDSQAKPILEIFQALVREVYGASARALSPRGMVSSIRRVGKQFKALRQEAAHEYLRQLLDCMHEEILKSNGLKNDTTSFICRVFGGQLCSTLTCPHCKHTSSTFNPYLDLSLEIGQGIQSVSQALQAFSRAEQLSAGNEWLCVRCAKRVRALKQLRVSTPAPVLVLHLKRFSCFGAKISKHVSFAPSLQLPGLPSHPYELSAVLVHHGASTHSGHYFAYVKASNGQWHEMNDSSVQPVGLQKVLQAQAYLLFYTSSSTSSAPSIVANGISTAPKIIMPIGGAIESKVEVGKKRGREEVEEDVGTVEMTRIAPVAPSIAPIASTEVVAEVEAEAKGVLRIGQGGAVGGAAPLRWQGVLGRWSKGLRTVDTGPRQPLRQYALPSAPSVAPLTASISPSRPATPLQEEDTTPRLTSEFVKCPPPVRQFLLEASQECFNVFVPYYVDLESVNNCLASAAKFLRSQLQEGVEPIVLPPTPQAKAHEQLWKCDSLLVAHISHSQERYTGLYHLSKAINACRTMPEKYYRCLQVVQSSGSGKSKICVELGHKERVVYIMCGYEPMKGHEDITVPRIVGTMLTALMCADSMSSREDMARRVLHCIVQAASSYSTAQDLFNAQFTNNGSAFFNSLASQWSGLPSPSKKSVAFINYDDDSLTIIFDEADQLSVNQKPTDSDSAFRCLCRMINQSKLLAVFLSTSARMITSVVPGHSHSRPADATDSARIYHPPITRVDFPDLFNSHPFVMGRPLWHSKYEAFHSYLKLVMYALNLLLGKISRIVTKQTIQTEQKIFRIQSCALFCVRLSYKPVSSFAAEFVAHNLATLVSAQINETNRHSIVLTAVYRSEPVLAEASAYHTTFEVNQDEAVRLAVHAVLANDIIEPSVGDKGELAVCAALLYSMDNIRKEKIGSKHNYNPDEGRSMSMEIPLTELLQAIGIDPKSIPHLGSYFVNFTHFYRVSHARAAQFKAAYARHGAVILPRGADEVDLVVVARSGPDKPLGAVVIQVKNWRNRISDVCAKEMLNACHIQFPVPDWHSTFCKASIVSILVATGGSSFKGNVNAVATLHVQQNWPIYGTPSQKGEMAPWTQYSCTLHSFRKLSPTVQTLLWEMAHMLIQPDDYDLMLCDEFGASGLLECQRQIN